MCVAFVLLENLSSLPEIGKSGERHGRPALVVASLRRVKTDVAKTSQAEETQRNELILHVWLFLSLVEQEIIIIIKVGLACRCR